MSVFAQVQLPDVLQGLASQLSAAGALVAFVATLTTIIALRWLKSRREALKAALGAQDPDAVAGILTKRFKLATETLAREQRFQLARETLAGEQKRSTLLMVLGFVFGLAVLGLVALVILLPPPPPIPDPVDGWCYGAQGWEARSAGTPPCVEGEAGREMSMTLHAPARRRSDYRVSVGQGFEILSGDCDSDEGEIYGCDFSDDGTANVVLVRCEGGRVEPRLQLRVDGSELPLPACRRN